MDTRQLIKYIIIIVIILAGLFLSQQAASRGIGKNLISAATNAAGAYLAKGSEWVTSNIYPKVSSEVQKRGDAIKNEINKEKEKVTENIGKKIQNYFTGISDSILHPGENNNCSTTTTQPPTGQ